MKTEFEKMRNGEMYYFSDREVYDSLLRAKELCCLLQTMTIENADYRSVIEELIPDIPKSTIVCPPFYCDHGNGIILGEGTFFNFGCTILDEAFVRIGANVKVGPNCQFYTPQHPIDYIERREPKEAAYPIVVGDDTWLGGGVVICPGVTIGNRCIVAAGSVVVRDIPDDCLAAGNPAVVKKDLRTIYNKVNIE